MVIISLSLCICPSFILWICECVSSGYWSFEIHALYRQICRANIKQKYSNHISTKFVTSAARNDLHHISYDDSPEEPFLLTLIKESLWYLWNFSLSSKYTSVVDHLFLCIEYMMKKYKSLYWIYWIYRKIQSYLQIAIFLFFRGLKSLFSFLIEQPSQLKYIEWPSFSNTVCLLSLLLYSYKSQCVEWLLIYLYKFLAVEDCNTDSCYCCVSSCCIIICWFGSQLPFEFSSSEEHITVQYSC
jgi:hypothetical protein